MVNLTKKAAAAAAGIAEGDYTSWTHKWTNDFPDNVGDYDRYGTFIDEKNEVLNVLWQDENLNRRLGIYNLADFSTVFQSPSGSNYMGMYPNVANLLFGMFGLANVEEGGFTRSLQSYVAIYKNDEVTIEVWRGGSSPLWTHDVQDDAPGLAGGALEISPTGKWLLAIPYWGAVYGRLVLYEGT